MKLLQCRACGDVVRLYASMRSCHCGRSRGRYINDTHVEVFGNARAIGIDTGSILHERCGTWAESDRIEDDETRARRTGNDAKEL